jgi:hypothetical protein
VVRHITKSDNWPHTLRWHYQLGKYCEVIHYPFIGHLNEDEIFCGYFQQDGATAHTARVSVTLLRNVFGDWIISKDIWPPRLPDLTRPDYYPWGAMKGAVYKDNPHILLELKEAISNFIRNIPPIDLSRVFANKIRRVDACLQVREGHSSIFCNLSKYKNVFILMYRDYLNILTVYGRCTGTFGSSYTIDPPYKAIIGRLLQYPRCKLPIL